MMTGGVAKNIAVVKALESRFKCQILVPDSAWCPVMHQLTYLACLFPFPLRYAFSYIAGLCAFRRALWKEKNTAQSHVI